MFHFSIWVVITWEIHLQNHLLSSVFKKCALHPLYYTYVNILKLKKFKKTKKSCEKITRQHKNTWNKCRLSGEISFCFRSLSANQRNSKHYFRFYFWFSWIWFSTLTEANGKVKSKERWAHFFANNLFQWDTENGSSPFLSNSHQIISRRALES